MLHAICDECGKKVNLSVNPTGAVEIMLEEPQVVEEEDGTEVDMGGEAVEIAVIDPSSGEALDKHLCRECLVFKIASVTNPDETPKDNEDNEGDDDDDDGGADKDGDGDGDGEAEPVGSPEDGEEKE